MANVMGYMEFSVAGEKKLCEDKEILKLQGIFAKHDIFMMFCDSVAGWWNLNQDWLSTPKPIEIETDWAWCLPTCFSDSEKDWLLHQLDTGRLICIVHYDLNGTIVAHH